MRTAVKAGDIVTAAVTTAPGRTELRELPVPETGPTDGLLLVEAAGMCGSDVKMYGADLPERVMGHENVGTLANVGEIAAERWGFADGDRVLLEEYLPCGHCHFCRTSEFRSCLASDTSANPGAVRFGSTPLSVAPAIWGGYAEVMYVHPSAVPHRVPGSVPSALATLGLPLGNGYQWVCLDGRVRAGETVVVLGPGQSGIGAVVAAKQAGATVIAVGRARDKARLEVARRLGADTVAMTGPDGDTTEAEVLERVLGLTGGRGADLVVDAAAGNDDTVCFAVDLLAKRGRLVLAAASAEPLSRFPVWQLSRKQIGVQAVRGHSWESVEWALALLASDTLPLDLMSTYEGGLADVDYALRATAGETGTPVLHATILPQGSPNAR
ncbi:zinc-binding dehydrogenase [Streptomyces sp. NPDC001315]|uniref:zinc-dependent alcohol dehydrogenase n=1 Tax=Streptomyces sp. NPDC001315 TaxID=3364562 RepID=UPI00369DD9A4